MRFVRAAVPAVAWMLVQSCWAQTPPMAANADPSYEVATIKPSQPDEQRAVMVVGPRLETRATSLVDLMMFAYGMHQTQIVDGPEWMEAAAFDVVMQPDLPGRPSSPQMKSIMGKLLKDRFQLTFHHAQRELPVYRLIAAKGGAKLTPATDEEKRGNTAAVGMRDGEMTVSNATMSEFASLMQRYVRLERPIVDHTGIEGKYDFKLKWTPDIPAPDGQAASGPRNAENADAPSLFTAMQEQLGLRLEAAKEPADVMVIDRVAKPSEN